MIRDLVHWHVDNGVGHIVLDRAEAANALDTATIAAFVAAVREVIDANTDAVLISSTGRQFCAGGDINEFVGRRADLHRLIQQMVDSLHPAILALATLPVPVISAVQGAIGGAGVAIALCADIVLATPAMKLRCGYSAIGLSPDLGASYFLSRRAGTMRAKNLLMTNRTLSAHECLSWGIIDELHSAQNLAAEAATLAARLAAGATDALGAIKTLCDSAFDHDLRTHLDLERAALLRCAVSGDAREGVSAFIEKRAPRFVDRGA